MSCPLCGGETCMVYPSTNASKFVCQKWNRSVCIVNDITSMSNESQKRKLFNLIFEWVIRKPYFDDKKTLWWFYNEPFYQTQESDDKFRVNLAEIPYPKSITEKIDRILLNLYNVNSDYGISYKIQSLKRAFFEDESFKFCAFKGFGYYKGAAADVYYGVFAGFTERLLHARLHRRGGCGPFVISSRGGIVISSRGGI